MPSCTLEIGGRIVVRSEGGPFDAEYALFEAHEIELRSNNEPGTVREHGYRTTPELALERLDAEGVTKALADAATSELGALVTAYARGPIVRRVASLLGVGEVFGARVWQASSKVYEGEWLDVAALANDLGLEGAPRVLQAVHLSALLREVPRDASVYLTTAEYMAGRRPGERTHKRVPLSKAAELPQAIQRLAERAPSRPPREGGPSRGELLEGVRERAVACLSDARTHLEALGKALSVRERPARGPLADPELWALEVQLSDGDPLDAQQRIEALEKTRGRQPGTAYLRGRAALLLHSEDPRLIAERAASLAMSMHSFAELELLAAEAWDQAGERKRALAYARDLADNPQVDPTLRARAQLIVAPPPPSAPDTVRGDVPEDITPSAPISSSVPTPIQPAMPVAITAGQRPSAPPPPAARAGETTRRSQVPTATTKSVRPQGPASTRSPSSSRSPQVEEVKDAISPTPILSIGVGPVSSRPPSPRRGPSDFPPASSEAIYAPPLRESQTGLRPPSNPGSSPQTATRPSLRAAANVATDKVASGSVPPAPPPNVTQVIPQTPPPPPPPPPVQASEPPPAAHTSFRPPMPSEAEEIVPGVVVKGGSKPPYVSEPPPKNFPAAPLIPRVDGERVEKAEKLSLPPGLHGESPIAGRLPTNAMEARIYFTHQSRELGRIYRQRYGVELRTDVRSIEIMQRHLVERFPNGELSAPEDVVEVNVHGAFLSEVLARRLGAEWTDLAVTEVGYWSMNVPPRTTVWPIGRVVRFVTMQHRERDLVSYFLELQARANGLR